MKYESLQKMTVITGLLVFFLGICSYAEDKVSMMKEASLPKEKASEIKSGNVSDDKERVSLMAVDGHPLDDDDFILSNVKMGDEPERIFHLNGVPDIVSHGTISDEYHWKDAGLTVVVNRKLPYAYVQRKDVQLKKGEGFSGVSRLYIDGKAAITKRGITVGSLRENVLRAYGAPEEVLWDGTDKSFYFIYKAGQKKIKFIIKGNKVKAFQFSVEDSGRAAGGFQSLTQKMRKDGLLPDKDFGIAGFKLDTKFRAHSWDTWQRKMSNPKEDVWYFSGYAVRATARSGIVQGLFLTDSDMVTTRGITLGDDLETAELIYGAPYKVEMDTSSGHLRTSYIYFSKDKRNILILFLTKQKIDGIVSAKNPQFSEKK